MLSLSAYLNLDLIFLSLKNKSVLIPEALKAVVIGKQGEISDDADPVDLEMQAELERMAAELENMF